MQGIVQAASAPSVSAREDRIGQAFERLEGQLDTLATRLGPVLAEPEPEPAPGVGLTSVPTARSMHAQRLDHLAAWAERLVDNTETLIGRVDL
jgi:hypothetical protein